MWTRRFPRHLVTLTTAENFLMYVSAITGSSVQLVLYQVLSRFSGVLQQPACALHMCAQMLEHRRLYTLSAHASRVRFVQNVCCDKQLAYNIDQVA